MIDIIEAQQLILWKQPLSWDEKVYPLLDSLRRVLARDIVATEDFPAADISTKDGYALRYSSLLGASAKS